MIRHPVWVLVFLGCTGVVAAEPLPSDHKISAPPGCLYQSKSYSDGAFICVQKSLMLNCTSDGTRPTWKIVAERDLAERCVGPTVLTYPPARRRHARRMHAIRRSVEVAGEGSAKCFTFSGKRYCE
jgi:hypothetical protein